MCLGAKARRRAWKRRMPRWELRSTDIRDKSHTAHGAYRMSIRAYMLMCSTVLDSNHDPRQLLI